MTYLGIHRCGEDSPLNLRGPQWSFLEDNTCAKARYELNRGFDYNPCKVQCEPCKEIATHNDYVRGMLPPRYPVPAVMEEVQPTYCWGGDYVGPSWTCFRLYDANEGLWNLVWEILPTSNQGEN